MEELYHFFFFNNRNIESGILSHSCFKKLQLFSCSISWGLSLLYFAFHNAPHNFNGGESSSWYPWLSKCGLVRSKAVFHFAFIHLKCALANRGWLHLWLLLVHALYFTWQRLDLVLCSFPCAFHFFRNVNHWRSQGQLYIQKTTVQIKVLHFVLIH